MTAFLTRLNNVLLWSDPVLSAIAFAAGLLLAVFVSSLLCVFTTNQAGSPSPATVT